MSDTMGTIGNNLNSTLSGILSNDFTKDPNFQAYQDQLNSSSIETFDNSVLSPLADRGLMRSSGLQKAVNSFDDTLAGNTLNLYDNYYNRKQDDLSTLLNTSNTLYNYMTGLTNGALKSSDAVNQHNMNAYKAEQAANSALFNTLANSVGSLAGSAAKFKTGL